MLGIASADFDALEKRHGGEAGALLRNHVETFLEYLKKSESDSGVTRGIQKDLEGAKEVQATFFPPESLSYTVSVQNLCPIGT